MVAVAALRRIQRLVEDYRGGSAPLELRRPGHARGLSPELQASVPPDARRVAGFAAMLTGPAARARLPREPEGREARRNEGSRSFFAALFVVGAAALLFTPTALHALFRMLS